MKRGGRSFCGRPFSYMKHLGQTALSTLESDMRFGHGICRRALFTMALFLYGATSVSHAQLTTDKSFRKTAEAARASLEAGDIATTRFHLSQLTPDSPFETYIATTLQLEIALKQGDVLAQRSAVARVIESGGVPQEQLAYFNYLAGYLSYQTGAIDNAVIYLERARTLGAPDPKALLMLAESYVRQRKIDLASAMLEEAITAQKTAGQTIPASWYERAASLAYQRKNWSALARYGAASLGEPNISPAQWRTVLATYSANAKPNDEARLDLYRLQAAVGALASERDYHDYARLAADLDYAAEAKAVIEAGKNDNILSSRDPVAKDILRSTQRKAVVQLSDLKALYGKADRAANAAKAMENGDALFAVSQYVQAIPYYRTALEKQGVDRDRVTVRLGIALARSGDLDGAIIALAQANSTWSDIAGYWTIWANARRKEIAPELASMADSEQKPAQ